MFIYYVIDFSTKKKICKDGGSCFYKNQKHRPLEIDKKISYFLSEFPNFLYERFYQKILHVLSERHFKLKH